MKRSLCLNWCKILNMSLANSLRFVCVCFCFSFTIFVSSSSCVYRYVWKKGLIKMLYINERLLVGRSTTVKGKVHFSTAKHYMYHDVLSVRQCWQCTIRLQTFQLDGAYIQNDRERPLEPLSPLTDTENEVGNEIYLRPLEKTTNTRKNRS